MQHIRILLLVHAAMCIDLEINGELSFDLMILDLDFDNNKTDFRSMRSKSGIKRKNNTDNGTSLKMLRVESPVSSMTAAPIVECVYQYPEKEQVDALLSNMMNQLTKMFIRAQTFLEAEDSRRKHKTRFRVIGKKDTDFFENIYNNMTEGYRIFYNKTADRVDRSGRDPCQHQEEIKEIWKELLEKSIDFLRRAVLQCVEQYLRIRQQTGDITNRSKLKDFLMSELGKMRSIQLDVLCDSFQLCFNDLL